MSLPIRNRAEQLIAKINHIIDTGTKVIYEHVITVPGGNFWQETSLSPMRDSNDNITAVVGFVRDITERKQAENKLHMQNAFLKLLKVAAVATNEAEEIKDTFLPILSRGYFLSYYRQGQSGQAEVCNRRNCSW